MGKFLLSILDKYGLDTVNIALLAWVSYKLFTNHFAHLLEAQKKNTKAVNKLDKDIRKLTSRVSKIEGRLKL